RRRPRDVVGRRGAGGPALELLLYRPEFGERARRARKVRGPPGLLERRRFPLRRVKPRWRQETRTCPACPPAVAALPVDPGDERRGRGRRRDVLHELALSFRRTVVLRAIEQRRLPDGSEASDPRRVVQDLLPLDLGQRRGSVASADDGSPCRDDVVFRRQGKRYRRTAQDVEPRGVVEHDEGAAVVDDEVEAVQAG